MNSEPCQISKMECFAKIVNGEKQLIIFTKWSILDVLTTPLRCLYWWESEGYVKICCNLADFIDLIIFFFWRLYKTLLLGNSRRAKYHLPKKLVHSSPMKTGDCLFCHRFFQQHIIYSVFNPLSANFTKWSSTLKQFVGRLPTNCLSVFDHFVGLALKGLTVVT